MPPNSTPPSAVQLPEGRISKLTRPIREFLRIESASGFVLLICTVIALVLANSRWAADYHHFWEIHFSISLGPYKIDEPLHFWVNDALMTLFFFVVGLEIKRELVGGELSTPQKAALPVIAALGGMVAPALIYLALEPGGPAQRGWGIPMATDIAFVVGVLSVFGQRAPLSLKIFLLSLAIADDIGAILVIAFAYSSGMSFIPLAAAFALISFCYVLNKLGVRSVGVYVVVGAVAWLAVLASGVHPTIEGVILGLLTPAYALLHPKLLDDVIDSTQGRWQSADRIDVQDLEQMKFAVRESLSPLERLIHLLHPWVGFVIMPLFALANAGVEIKLSAITDPVAVAVAAGLTLGKPLGIFLCCFLAVKLGLARLPSGTSWLTIFGAGCLAGIGFTMSLFIANMAFEKFPELLDASKIGILLGSALSAALGTGILLISLPKKASTQ